MTELEASGMEEHPPPYIIFVVVFLFFLTGLFGFLICHLLKKKGYRCRTGDMDDAEEEEEEEEKKFGGNADDEDEENQDTVEQILKCIIENEANMEAFNEMLGNHNVCVRHDPRVGGTVQYSTTPHDLLAEQRKRSSSSRLRKESIGGIPSHHHTVHSGSDHNSCHLCAQVRSKKGRRQSRTPRSKHRPGEQTVFSVGRFRVTHHDKKLHGGPNPMVSSGDQLDQSQDSEERKEGYNLRSMFKDARPPSESSNGVAPNVGKRRKSVTIFGLRRGSDPVGIKVGEGTARETGGVRFVIQKQPVVLEELLQKEDTEVTPEHGTKPGIKPETEPSKNQICAPPHREDKTIGIVNSSSSQTNVKAHDSSPAPNIGSKHGPSLEPCTNIMIKPTTGKTAGFGPSSLPIPSPASSRQIFKTMEKGEDVEDKMLRIKDAYDPGPLQTSTPIAPMHGFISSFTPVIPADQPEPYSSTGFPITQTPPIPSPSPDLEQDFGASLAFISLGSSPPSSFQIKTVSSVSSLGTPTSPLAVTPSPKLSTRKMPSEDTKTDFSPALTPSPKLPSGRAMSSQSPTTYSSASPLRARASSPAPVASPKLDTMPVSPQTSSPADQNLAFESPHCLTLKSESVTSITSMTKGDMVSSPLSLKEQELEGATIPKSEGKTERKTVGIIKTLKISSPTDRLSKDRLSTLPLSHSSLMSPSSPIGSRGSNVTIVKASPDSKREFSVVTMVEEEESSTYKVGISSADSQGGKLSASGVGQSESQCGETSGAEDRPIIYQEKDDMVEMEDIRDCQVQQVE